MARKRDQHPSAKINANRLPHWLVPAPIAVSKPTAPASGTGDKPDWALTNELIEADKEKEVVHSETAEVMIEYRTELTQQTATAEQ